jgi:hypothetical protein
MWVMGIKYTESKILEMAEAAFGDSSKAFYNANVVNKSGETDTGKKITEIIAGLLSTNANIERFNGKIIKIRRGNSYHTLSHDGNATTGNTREQSSRVEEYAAMALFKGKNFQLVGEIKDYQTPRKNIRDDKAGKIDLLSYDKGLDSLNIIELKRPNSKETLLRCVLEVYTYWYTIEDKEQFLKDFKVPEDTRIRRALLVFEDSTPYRDFMCEKQVNVRALMKKLEVDLYVLRGDGNYTIAKAYLHDDDYKERAN